eukprot:SAG11_NODE_7092_length_1195_cov_1.114051_1_plen_170_part_10
MPSRQRQLHDKVTLANCAAACAGLRMPLAGIETGNHCSCGRSLSNAPATLRVAQSECEVDHCHGNASELCGGGSRMLVYSYTCAPPNTTVQHGDRAAELQIDDQQRPAAAAAAAAAPPASRSPPFKFERPVLIGESPPASVTGAKGFSHFWFPEAGAVIGKSRVAGGAGQ